MSETIPPIGSFAELEETARRNAMSVAAACDELPNVFLETATRVARSAELVADAVAQGEVRARVAPYDLNELLVRCEQNGPHALTNRERKALIASRDRLSAVNMAALLEAYPSLQEYATRVCLTYWPYYVRESWGEAYYAALRPRFGQLKLTVSKASGLSASTLLSRLAPAADTELAARLPSASLVAAYERLKGEFGVRDSWLLSGSVLSAWLIARLQRGARFDGPVRELLEHERLRALLLPLPKNGNGPTVRSTVETHARTVATFLAASYASPVPLARAALVALTDHVVKSTFGDPRAPLRSDGWREVRRLYEDGFRKLLTSLCEQDLEVFFKHAMHEPDRHEFWLRYLPSLERTGCVLDRSLRKRLDAKLVKRPELQGALERAYPFSGTSDVQAFYLVFNKFVVIEFSHTGNAAYVYKREFIEKNVEPHIRNGRAKNVSELKVNDRVVHRVLHKHGWEEKTTSWLAEQGIHPRAR